MSWNLSVALPQLSAKTFTGLIGFYFARAASAVAEKKPSSRNRVGDRSCEILWVLVGSESARSMRANQQNRIARVLHDPFGDAAEHPARHTRPAVGGHGDQIIPRRARQVDNFARRVAFNGARRDGFDALGAQLVDFGGEVWSASWRRASRNTAGP